MKKIYAKGAISMLPSGKGFIFTALQNQMEDKVVVSYKMHSLIDGTTSLITRNVFLLAKFGTNFEFYEKQLKDYINCKTAFLNDYRLLIIYPDGRSMIYDNERNLKWSGELKYKDYGPADIAIQDNYLWCSYPENSAIIKYNINSMRQDFRIGGSATGGLNDPFGIFLTDDNHLIITSSATGEIHRLSLSDFSLEYVGGFSEPVYQYLKIDSNEIVLTHSGIYRL